MYRKAMRLLDLITEDRLLIDYASDCKLSSCEGQQCSHCATKRRGAEDYRKSLLTKLETMTGVKPCAMPQH